MSEQQPLPETTVETPSDSHRDADRTPTGSDAPPCSPSGWLDAHTTRFCLRDPVQQTAPEQPICGHAGRNLLFGEIARGGMAAVLKGHDPDLGRDLAVKVLLEAHRDRPELVQRFLEEAQIAGQLQHPGIVPVYDLGRFGDDRPFFTMKLVRGQTLAEFLKQRTSPHDDLPRFLTIFEQICQTLAYAHARGVIHRDLKPANVMVGAFGEVQVMDWGMAKVLPQGGAGEKQTPPVHETHPPVIRTARSDSASDSSLPGTMMGTPGYMPPEQANGAVTDLDERTDVFGLGAILCVILTGRPPYVDREREQVYRMAQEGNLADAFTRLAGCGADAELVQLCRECLAAQREDRPRDGGEVARRVAAYRAGVQERLRAAELERAAAEARAEEAKATAAAARARAVAERRARWLTVGLAVTVLGLAALAAWGWWNRQRQQTELRQAITTALEQTAELQQQGRWAEARVVLDQADDRLGETGPADLRQRLEQARADLTLVGRLEAVRLQDATLVGGKFDSDSTERNYAAVFGEAGLVREGEDVATVEDRIRGSAIREQLVDALDEWAGVTKDRQQRAWLLEIAGRAAPDERHNHFRNPELWKDRDALQRLADEALQAKLSPGMLATLGVVLRRSKADAVPFLTAAQTQHPNDFWLNLVLGNALAGAKKWEEAVGYYRAALALRPSAAVALGNLANSLTNQARTVEALGHYRRARELDPKNPLTALNFGTALMEKGQPGEAIPLLREAVELAPGLTTAHVNLGNALQRVGRMDEAIAEYRKALAFDPSDASAHTNLGSALAAKGDLDAAVAEYRRALESDPEAARALANLGNALRAKSDLDSAIACYRKAIALDPQLALAHSNLGALLFEKGQRDEAVTHVRKAIELDPRLAEARYNRGVMLQGEGQMDRAIAEYRTAIELDPNYAPAHAGLGALLQVKGRLDEAVAEYRKAIRLDPGRALTYYNLGTALTAQGKRDEAVAEYRRAIEVDPKLARAHTDLGLALFDKAQTEEAIAEYRKAVEFDPKYAPAHGALGLALLKREQFAEASAATRRCVELLPPGDPVRAEAAQQLEHCERLIALGEKLPALLKGEERTAGAAERLTAARFCQEQKRRYADAVRLYAEAFAAKPDLVKNPAEEVRYSAACAAALAAAGQGEGGAKLDEPERVRLRKQALDWLRADLALWSRLAESDKLKFREEVQRRMRHWQNDTDLAGLRDKVALDKLSDAERAGCRDFWAEVTSVMKKAEKK
jgi:tetratricopeptide (TPR) repeat protein